MSVFAVGPRAVPHRNSRVSFGERASQHDQTTAARLATMLARPAQCRYSEEAAKPRRFFPEKQDFFDVIPACRQRHSYGRRAGLTIRRSTLSSPISNGRRRARPNRNPPAEPDANGFHDLVRGNSRLSRSVFEMRAIELAADDGASLHSTVVKLRSQSTSRTSLPSILSILSTITPEALCMSW